METHYCSRIRRGNKASCWAGIWILINCMALIRAYHLRTIVPHLRNGTLYQWITFFSQSNTLFIIIRVCVCVCVCACTQSLSQVQLFASPWTVALQAPLSMGFSRQEFWSGLPFSTLGDLSNLGIKLVSPALAYGFFTIEPLGKLP